jgi:glycosyltransferase involved in cell wall biosynthesis
VTGLQVLVVTTVHTPLDARIHHRQIRTLVAAGDRVTYAAPFGATSTARTSVLQGVRTFDLPRAVGRRRAAALRAARRLIEVEGPRHDLVLLHDPELALAVAGRLRRLPPVILDVHEDLVGSLPDRPWVPDRLRPLAVRGGAALERWAEQHLHLLLAEEGYRERFAGEHPVIPNLPWLPQDAPGAGTHRRVVYVGRISRGRGVAELLGVGASLTSSGGPALELVGTPDAEVRCLVEAADERGDLRWHGFLPNDDALDLVRGAVAGLSLLHDLPNYRRSMPTKVVEYLSVGVPAITTPLPAAEGLVRAADAGLVVPFGDVDAVVAAVRRLDSDASLRARLGANGRAHVAAELSWDAVAPRFVSHLHDLARAAR